MSPVVQPPQELPARPGYDQQTAGADDGIPDPLHARVPAPSDHLQTAEEGQGQKEGRGPDRGLYRTQLRLQDALKPFIRYI